VELSEDIKGPPTVKFGEYELATDKERMAGELKLNAPGKILNSRFWACGVIVAVPVPGTGPGVAPGTEAPELGVNWPLLKVLVASKKLPGELNAEATGLKFIAVTEPPVVPLVAKLTPLRTALSGITDSAFNWPKDLNVRGVPIGVIAAGVAWRGVVVTTACAAGATAEKAMKAGKARNLCSFMGVR
jgi:hypothetical protein